MIQLLKDAMLKHPDSPGFLIDGFPREISQGVQFEEEVSHWTGRVYNLNLNWDPHLSSGLISSL